MKSIILKVQKPIATTGDPNIWMFYPQDRRYNIQREPTKAEEEAMGQEFKIYGYYSGNLEFISKAPDQDW